MPPNPDKAKKAHEQRSNNPQMHYLLYILLIGLGLAIFLTASGFTFAYTQEQRDSFCSSCLTQPESTFYQRRPTNYVFE